jgi:hypothetical protein
MGGSGLSGPARRRKKKRIANGEWRIGMTLERPVDQFVSGPEGVAGCNDLGGVLLSTDVAVPSRRAVWSDCADQTRCGFGAGEHRRRAWSREYRQFRSASANFAGLAKGVGNAHSVGGARRNPGRCQRTAGPRSVRESGQDASRIDSVTTGQAFEMIAIRHSLFAIRPQAKA